MIQVLDNPISNEYADNIDMLFRSNQMPWYFESNIAIEDDSKKLNNIHYGFSHWSYRDNHITDNDIFSLLNILYACDKVNDVYQIRSFMHTPSLKPNTINGPHIDLDYPHKVCLYYVNDSDGDTIFFDNNDNEIYRNTPKKNTAILFDGSIKHSSSTPTNFRYIINFDYI